MSKKKKVTKKKKQAVKQTKSCNKKCEAVCTREKVCGEPNKVVPYKTPVNIPPVPDKPLTYINGELYPRLVFKQSLWTRFLRFFGLVP